MTDITGSILGALAVVLFGAAFAVGWQVIRDAWRGAWHDRSELSGAKPPRPPVAWGRSGTGNAPADADAPHRGQAKGGRP